MDLDVGMVEFMVDQVKVKVKVEVGGRSLAFIHFSIFRSGITGKVQQ